MGLLERVLEEEKKQKSLGLLQRANFIRTLSRPADSPLPASASPASPEDEKKNFPTQANRAGKTFPIRKKE
jgi:hypothetical protein